MAPTCNPHEIAVRNWAVGQVQVGHVRAFPLEVLSNQMASFYSGSYPMCRSAAMHRIA